MADTFRLMLQLKKWLFAPDANLEYCRCLLVRLVHQKCVLHQDAYRNILYTERPSHAHFLSCKTTEDRSSGYAELCAPKTVPT